MTDSRVGLVLVNGPPGSVQGPRARALFGGAARIVYKQRGRFGSIREIGRALRGVEGGWIYCIDLGFPGALLAALRRRRSPPVRLAYEIGDPARPLLANQGRPGWEVVVADQLDRRLPPRADRLVFRGSYLADYFRDSCRVEMARLDRDESAGGDHPTEGREGSKVGRRPGWAWIPDGVDCEVFRPCRDDPEVAALRRAHGLEGRFVVGLVGSIHHDPVHDLFYGWELAEALALIPAEVPVAGVLVGDGPGLPVLEAARDRLGLGDRLKLPGRVPHEQVPVWMNVLDVGLSTQTDDPVGWGRTTAKLPEYLACGTPVVCSDVGEAHRLLASSGQTLPYRGMRDDSYPPRLADRLRAMMDQDLGPLRASNRALALRLFDYPVLRRRLDAFLGGALCSDRG